jgi:hypothetical protein
MSSDTLSHAYHGGEWVEVGLEAVWDDTSLIGYARALPGLWKDTAKI